MSVAPRIVYRHALQLDTLLDLTNAQVRDSIGVTAQDLPGRNWALCQQIGTQVHSSGDQGIRSPSATGTGDVVVLFPELLGAGLLEVEQLEQWNSGDDLSPGRAPGGTAS